MGVWFEIVTVVFLFMIAWNLKMLTESIEEIWEEWKGRQK